MQKAIEAILAEDLAITPKEADTLFNAVLVAIAKALEEDPDLRISGLGRFQVLPVKATTRRNPKTGEAIEKPAKNRIKFTPYAPLLEVAERLPVNL